MICIYDGQTKIDPNIILTYLYDVKLTRTLTHNYG